MPSAYAVYQRIDEFLGFLRTDLRLRHLHGDRAYHQDIHSDNRLNSYGISRLEHLQPAEIFSVTRVE